MLILYLDYVWRPGWNNSRFVISCYFVFHNLKTLICYENKSWSLRIWKLSCVEFWFVNRIQYAKCITGFELLLLISLALLHNLAGTLSLSVFPRYYLFLSLIYLFFDSQWSHRREHREIEGGGVRWPRWQEVSQRYRCLWYWYSLCPFWGFLILLFSSFLFFILYNLYFTYTYAPNPHTNEPSLELIFRIEYEERKLGCCFPLLL